MSAVQVPMPDKLIDVFSGEADVRGAYGGRGSGKTRTFAKMTAVRAYMWANAGKEGIILCGRQYMNSLDESSMEEIKAAIREEPWLDAFFEIGEKYIRTRCGRISYKFAGLDRNLSSIKSKARILLCWVDEAEPVTHEAWKILIPTLRDEESELWVTWNPERKGSPTDRRFRNSKDPRTKVAMLNWRDNPKFPAILERARQKDLVERPDDYDNIWEGAYGVARGAILGKWVSKAAREGRINPQVEFDPMGAPLEISSDIGFRDTAAWWYWQRCVGGFRVLKYEGDSGLDADDWIPRIQDTVRSLGITSIGKIWLPHDARAKTFQSKHSTMERFLTAFGPSRVGVVPQSRKGDQINAARLVIDKCEINSDLCEEGIDGLNGWEFEWNDDTEIYSKEPLHNWASHPGDAFSYGAQIMQEALPKRDIEVPPVGMVALPQGGFSTGMSLEQMWKQTPKRSARI